MSIPQYGRFPLNNTTPFTFRDSYTFLELLNEFLEDVQTVEKSEIEFKKAVNEALAAGKKAADDFMADMTTKYQTILGQLIGYTITVDSDGKYKASMMDGSVFEAYTVSGVDALINNLRNTLTDDITQLESDLEQTNAVFADNVNKTIGPVAHARFRTEYVAPTPSNPEYYVTFVYGVYKVPYAITKALGNPKSGTHQLLTMQNYVNRTGCNFVANASGWRSTGEMMGLQILNGVLLHGWDTHITYDPLGRESLVIMKDGTWRIYDFTTPPQKIIDDGGWNSFTWGHALYKNGVAQDILSKSGYQLVSGRHLIGVTNEGVVAVISFPGKTGSTYGATGGQVLQALAGYNWEFLYFLDGGGSTQQYHESFPMVHSTDSGGVRAVADVIGFNGSLATKPATVWQIVAGRLNGYSAGGVSFLVEPESLRIRVQSVAVENVTTRNDWSTVFTLPAWVPKPLYQVIGTAYLSQSYLSAVPVRVMTNGDVQAMVPDSVNGYLSFSVNVSTEGRFRDYIVE